MVEETESNEKSRFWDLNDEPIDRFLSPIHGYEDQPILPLMDTTKSIFHLFHHLEFYTKKALKNCQNPADGLTPNESAAMVSLFKTISHRAQ